MANMFYTGIREKVRQGSEDEDEEVMEIKSRKRPTTMSKQKRMQKKQIY